MSSSRKPLGNKRAMIQETVGRFERTRRIPNKYSGRPKNWSPLSVKDSAPPLEFWQQSILGGSLSPEECHHAASIYCELVDPKMSTWKGKLVRDHNITRETLHALAVIQVSGPPSPLWKLGLHMLSTASDMGFVPSTLLMIRLLRQSKEPDTLAESELFTNALARFRALARESRDRDVLTLRGLIEAERGDDTKALASFDQAVQVRSRTSGKPVPETTIPAAVQGLVADAGHSSAEPKVRPFRWTWEASCHIGRAKILLSRGRREEAATALRVAALELDNPQGYLELAKVLPEDAPERAQYLKLAAVSGLPEACYLLGKGEAEMATRSGQSEYDAHEHNLWASEWFSLAHDWFKPAGVVKDPSTTSPDT